MVENLEVKNEDLKVLPFGCLISGIKIKLDLT